MRDIYASCIETLIYLGEPPSSSVDGENLIEGTRPIVWHGDVRDKPALDSYWNDFSIDQEQKYHVKSINTIDRTFHAFAFLRLLAADLHLTQLPPFQKWEKATEDSYCIAVTDALMHIGQSPWWRRVWTVQETVMPPKAMILYGPVVVPLSLLYLAWERFGIHFNSCCLHNKVAMNVGRGLVEIMGQDMDEIMTLRDVFVRGVNHNYHGNIFRLCTKFGARASTDPVDKVYALLGLVTNWYGREPILPDYTVSTTSLYRRLTVDVLLTDMTLHAIIGDMERKDHPELPSWVIDWTNRNVEDVDCDRKQLINNYRATGETKANIQFLGFSILRVTGFQVDWVCEVLDPLRLRAKSNPPNTISSDQRILCEFYRLAGLHQEPDRPYPGGGTYREAFWRVLCGDGMVPTVVNGPESVTRSFRRATSSDSVHFEDWAMCTVYSPFTAEPNGLTEEESAAFKNLQGFGETRAFPKNDPGKRSFQGGMTASVRNRSLFITQGGFLGIGHCQTKPGDELFMLIGANVPFALRPNGDTTNGSEGSGFRSIQRGRPLHKIVGDCYLHGLMDGQAMQGQYSSVDDVYLV